MLVYASVKSVRDTFVVLANIPVACAGGIIALFAARLNFSVSAAMGFVSVFGIAIQDALLVVSFYQRVREGEDGPSKSVREAAHEAGTRWLRPVLMTASVAIMGLLPAALSHGIGSETQKPLAVVVIGGALLLSLVPRLVLGPLLVLAHAREEAVDANAPVAVPAE
jgi:cobalt-zinc-cadmium resistance protein CzcA